jgi:hypothetical protein
VSSVFDFSYIFRCEILVAASFGAYYDPCNVTEEVCS